MRKRRSTALAAALTGAFLFTACGIIKTYPQVNTARFHSDLSLTMISAESMDREYYDLDQLQTVILDAVNDYNEKNPDAISIDYYHVEGELATLILTYQNADHCTAFNEQPVLYGPAAEAWEQGQMDGIGWISADTAIGRSRNRRRGNCRSSRRSRNGRRAGRGSRGFCHGSDFHAVHYADRTPLRGDRGSDRLCFRARYGHRSPFLRDGRGD